MAFIFKIKIRDVAKPPVWRRVVIPHEYSLEKTHCVIQAAFGWTNSHMYKFSDKPYGGTFEIRPLFEEDKWIYEDLRRSGRKLTDSADIRLCDVFKGGVRKLVYLYDFGDDWVHDMTLEDIILTHHDHALCTAGKGACPPEDCGGPCGYEYMKEVLAHSPGGNEARQMKKLLKAAGTDGFDPKSFTAEDIGEINEILEYIEEHVK